MNISDAIVMVMIGFACFGGGVWAFTGRDSGLAGQFQQGILTTGFLGAAMLGMMTFVPVMVPFIKPSVMPLCILLGIDPAMFASFTAIDMGAIPAAVALQIDPVAGKFSSYIVASMQGATLVFTLPLALAKITQPSDRKLLSLGILAGFTTMWLGSFVGGCLAGFNVWMMVHNLIPAFLTSAVIIFGLWRFQKTTIQGFICFGRGVLCVTILLSVAALVLAVCPGVKVSGATPIAETAPIILAIGFMVAGAYVAVYCIEKLFRKSLKSLGSKLGINETATMSLFASLANAVAMIEKFSEMDSRGKVYNMAFAVSAAFTLADHMAFTAINAPELVFALCVGKLAGGASAIVVAHFVYEWSGFKEEPLQQAQPA